MARDRLLTLEDTVTTVSIDLKKLQALVGDLQDDYFDRFDHGVADDHMGIIWDYKHYAILNSIVLDILRDLAAEVEKVEESAADDSVA